MSRPTVLRVLYRNLTPLYLGGAHDSAEWRGASLKGALRFWYRAVDPQHREPGTWGASRDDGLFGGTHDGAGQSCFLLRMGAQSKLFFSWKSANVNRFTEGSGTNARNGLSYLGYPFRFKDNLDRTAIPPDTPLSLHLVMPRPLQEYQRLGLLAAVWLLGSLGSLGSRSRRGFGSLELVEWQIEEGSDAVAWEPLLAALPVLGQASTPAQWLTGLNQGLTTLRQDWFAGTWDNETPQHPHLGAKLRVHVGHEHGFADWENALNYAGRALQDFRVRRQPDYSAVKQLAGLRTTGRGKGLLRAPERIVFGLPLTFRFSSVSQSRPITFVPLESRGRSTESPLQRHPSLLLIKLVKAGDRFLPLFVRLDGPLPGFHPRAAVSGSAERLEPPDKNLLDAFMDNLPGEHV